MTTKLLQHAITTCVPPFDQTEKNGCGMRMVRPENSLPNLNAFLHQRICITAAALALPRICKVVHTRERRGMLRFKFLLVAIQRPLIHPLRLSLGCK
jgi:hypothetical protein